jgi:hypothetical protein
VVTRLVPRDAYVTVQTNRYPVPFTWARRDVTVRVLAEQIAIHLEGAEPITHPRLEGKHQVARWMGAPRPLPKGYSPAQQQPPRLDPAYVSSLGDVDVRPLSWYQEVAR